MTAAVRCRGAALLQLRYLFVFVELVQKRMRYAFNQSDCSTVGFYLR
jgi:hypothetical protein